MQEHIAIALNRSCGNDFTERGNTLKHTTIVAFDIKDLMGHKTLSVTVDYAHASTEAMRWAVERLREPQAQVVEFQAAG